MIQNARITYPAPNLVSIVAPCRVTGEKYELVVNRAAYQKWQDGALIQNVFPEMDKADREFLISGTSPKGWKELFG